MADAHAEEASGERHAPPVSREAVCAALRQMRQHTTWKVSCNTLNLREKSAERFFHVVSITY